MLKLIYLAKRKPGFTFDEFVRRWRMHGARGMEGAFWRHALGYVQAEPIRPTPIPRTSEEFDAVAYLILTDDAFAEPPDVAEANRIAQDELETFSGPIPNVWLFVNEERLLDGELGGTTAFFFFANGALARESADRLRSASGLNRIIVNTRRDDGPLGPEANTLKYEAIVEVSASSIPDLAAALESNGEDLMLKSELAVVTREAVFWDRMPSG